MKMNYGFRFFALSQAKKVNRNLFLQRKSALNQWNCVRLFIAFPSSIRFWYVYVRKEMENYMLTLNMHSILWLDKNRYLGQLRFVCLYVEFTYVGLETSVCISESILFSLINHLVLNSLNSQSSSGSGTRRLSTMTDGNKPSSLNSGASTEKVKINHTENGKPHEKNGTKKKAIKSGSDIQRSAHFQDPLDSPNYFASYDALRDLCNNNVEYFRTDDTESGQRFLNAYLGLLDHIETARGYVDQIRLFAHEYDFNAETPGNGYRSFLLVVRSCINHSVKLSSHVMQRRSSMLFRKSLYMK